MTKYRIETPAGSIIITGNPKLRDGDSFTINKVQYTFRNKPKEINDIKIGKTGLQTAENIQAKVGFINGGVIIEEDA